MVTRNIYFSVADLSYLRSTHKSISFLKVARTQLYKYTMFLFCGAGNQTPGLEHAS
jgi:hypothetical protein